MAETKEKIETLKSELDRVLDQRDNLFPVREEKNSRDMHRLLDEFSGRIIRTAEKSRQELDPGAIKEAEAMLDSPVVICGFHKSGTTLLCSLLDDHPSLVVLPGDARMRDWFEDTEPKPPDSPRRHFLSYLINPRGQRPFWFLGEKSAAYRDFVNYFDSIKANFPDGPLNLFLSGVMALHCANQQSSGQPVAWVEKTPLNELYVDKIAAQFPKARFIHVVRNPLANLASVKRLYRNRAVSRNARIRYRANVLSKRFCLRQSGLLHKSMAAGLANQKLFGPDRHLILRYEDLTAELEAQTERIAAFLNIPWRKSFLVPTNNGIPTVANSMYASRKVEGRVVNGTGDYWKRELSATEMRLAKAALADLAARYGYDLG